MRCEGHGVNETYEEQEKTEKREKESQTKKITLFISVADVKIVIGNVILFRRPLEWFI